VKHDTRLLGETELRYGYGRRHSASLAVVGFLEGNGKLVTYFPGHNSRRGSRVGADIAFNLGEPFYSPSHLPIQKLAEFPSSDQSIAESSKFSVGSSELRCSNCQQHRATMEVRIHQTIESMEDHWAEGKRSEWGNRHHS
jgi:hypothetical protein